MRPRSVPAPTITNDYQPMLYKEPSIMDSMYIPNNPQYGLQLEYSTNSPATILPSYHHHHTSNYPNGILDIRHHNTEDIVTTQLPQEFSGPSLTPNGGFNGTTTSLNSPITVQICGVDESDQPISAQHHHHHHHQPPFEEVNDDVLCEISVGENGHPIQCCSITDEENLCGHHHGVTTIHDGNLCAGNHSDLELCSATVQQSVGGLCEPNNSLYTGNNTTQSGSSYWATDVDMGTFSLPPLDLDPLPSLFPFSPCSANNFKSECLNGNGTFHHHQQSLGVKQPHDMADVLLSLKHAVVHPGQTSTTSSGGGAAPLSPPNFATAAAYPQQSQLPYSMHPHQMLMSPSAYSTSFCDQSGMFGPTNGACQGHQQSGPSAMFPSMSVNVSMNMTMHGYPPPYPESIQHQVTCPQMQWSTSPQNTSPVYHQQAQGILSPNYTGGATYSFTADFRTPTGESPLITTSSSFKPVLNKNSSFSQLAGLRSRRQSLGYSSLSPVGPTKVHTGALSSEDESQRPNLCRICGKTYARPSTLKTHLRTHSGEKPYRCGDCNKSFSQAANLTAHVRTHSGEKPFRCPICDRRFSQSSSVTTHMRTHSGERPYRCRMCKKAFSDSSTLTKHLRIHSGEKPYQCKLCLLRFSQSGNLNRHMRVHGTNNQMLGSAG